MFHQFAWQALSVCLAAAPIRPVPVVEQCLLHVRRISQTLLTRRSYPKRQERDVSNAIKALHVLSTGCSIRLQVSATINVCGGGQHQMLDFKSALGQVQSPPNRW